jgi:hypothetical protein
MRTEVRLSTKFLTTQNAHQVGMLVSLLAPPHEIADLRAEAARLSDCHYAPGDRKYHHARAVANRDLKAQYLEQVSRKRRR